MVTKVATLDLGRDKYLLGPRIGGAAKKATIAPEVVGAVTRRKPLTIVSPCRKVACRENFVADQPNVFDVRTPLTDGDIAATPHCQSTSGS
jgi:hypothetical protein